MDVAIDPEKAPRATAAIDAALASGAWTGSQASKIAGRLQHLNSGLGGRVARSYLWPVYDFVHTAPGDAAAPISAVQRDLAISRS